MSQVNYTPFLHVTHPVNSGWHPLGPRAKAAPLKPSLPCLLPHRPLGFHCPLAELLGCSPTTYTPMALTNCVTICCLFTHLIHCALSTTSKSSHFLHLMQRLVHNHLSGPPVRQLLLLGSFRNPSESSSK